MLPSLRYYGVSFLPLDPPLDGIAYLKGRTSSESSASLSVSLSIQPPLESDLSFHSALLEGSLLFLLFVFSLLAAITTEPIHRVAFIAKIYG